MPTFSGLTELAPRGLRDPGAVMEPDALRQRLQALTGAIATDERAWDDAARREVLEIFETRADTWSERKSSAYLFPLLDALRRGGVARGGTALEIGAATGIQVVTLASHFGRVLSLDISLAMLAHHPRSCSDLLAADGARLPLCPSSLDALVCVNAFVFPAEYARVLQPSGVLVFASTRAERTPIYLDPPALLTALRAVDPSFVATTSLAAEGCWTVARRARADGTIR